MLTRVRAGQRGSVLSGVLVIVAFLSIIIGALLWLVTTNLDESRVATTQVSWQAALTSAMEYEIQNLQTCPSGNTTISPVTMTESGRSVTVDFPSVTGTCGSGSGGGVITAGAGRLSVLGHCMPSSNGACGTPSQFNADGAYFCVTNATPLPAGCFSSTKVSPFEEWYAIDDGGNIYDYRFAGNPNAASGGTCDTGIPPVFCPYWVNTKALSSAAPTGPPLSLLDPSTGSGNPAVVTLVPVGSSVAAMTRNPGKVDAGKFICSMGATNGATVNSAPGLGVNNPSDAFFGDSKGTIFAYTATSNGNCGGGKNGTPLASSSAATSSPGPVVAGPFVFPTPGCTSSHDDDVFAVLKWDGSASGNAKLVHYVFTPATNVLHPGRMACDGVTAASSTTVTSASANFTAADVGSAISGGSIPASTTISSVTSSTAVKISHAATSTATGISLSIGSNAGSPSSALDLGVSVGNGGAIAAASSSCPLARCNYTAALPAQLAVSFNTGKLAIVSLSSAAAMSVSATATLTGATLYNKAPLWCPAVTCGSQVVGIDGSDGLHVMSTSLSQLYHFAPADSSPFHTSPTVIVDLDSVTKWVAGADDGYLYEMKAPSSGSTMVSVACPATPNIGFGKLVNCSSPTGPLRSSPIAGLPSECNSKSPCMFVASQDNSAYYLNFAAPASAFTLIACIDDAANSGHCLTPSTRLTASWEQTTNGAGNANVTSVLSWSYFQQ